MKIKLLLCFFLCGNLTFSQENKLTNEKLIKYFSQINKAELKITENKLDSANQLYKAAFKTYEQKFAKDSYNSLLVALKIKDWKNAHKQYADLKCLGFNYDESKLPLDFLKYHQKRKNSCTVKIDLAYKKTLDSLLELDQKYRNLSGGNYSKFKKELTETDSITSTTLQTLLQKKGFPNEYEIGVHGSDKRFFHNFYFIIWHQLATNLYSPQRVNFSKEIYKALNNGKITPENAGFLLDLSNGSSLFSNMKFEIHSFITLTDNFDKPFLAIENKQYTEDCCYVAPIFFPDKRDERGINEVKSINNNRTQIGLSNLDDELKKIIFSFKNDEYLLVRAKKNPHQFAKPEDGENFKKHLIKLESEK